MSNWLLTVGMEVHVELETKSKMFCGCANDPFGSEPNIHVCPVCYGLPGALPLLNRQAIEMTVKLGQSLKGTIPDVSFWARKNYFYPDLPKGYQISQSSLPLVSEAVVIIDGQSHRIERIHLEEDAGKLMHSPEGKTSLVNYNRAGVPLMEIVTYPDFHSGESAKRFCQELQRILRTLKISTADMEKGQMRCEANISVAKNGELGVKVEIKNINSFRSVERAIEYEFNRQTSVLESGGTIEQETRTWNEIENKTVVMRKKETSADYRYFPEPDLPAVRITTNQIEAILLPNEQRQSLQNLGVTSELIQPIIDRNYFVEILALGSEGPEAAKLFLAIPNFSELTQDDRIELLKLRKENGWTMELTSEVITKAVTTNSPITEVAKQFVDTNNVESLIAEVINEQPKAVEDYKAGKGAILNFLVGQVMAKAKGRANINIVREELLKTLK